MKKVLFVVLPIIFLMSCIQKSSDSITDNEKKEIISDVTKVAYQTIEVCNKIDLQTCIGFFMNSSEFLAVSTDGTILNYEQKINGEKEFFNSVSSLHLEKLVDDFKVLGKANVLWTVQFKVDAVLKTGEKLSFEKLIVTEIYKKVDTQWKISFSQESGLAPVISK
jgi:hypothetical protein